MKTKDEIKKYEHALLKEVKSLKRHIDYKNNEIEKLAKEYEKYATFQIGDIFNIDCKSCKIISTSSVLYPEITIQYTFESIQDKSKFKNKFSMREDKLLEDIENGVVTVVTKDMIPSKNVRIKAPKIFQVSEIRGCKKIKGKGFNCVFETVDEKRNKTYIQMNLNLYYPNYLASDDFKEYFKNYNMQFRRRDLIDKSFSYVLYTQYKNSIIGRRKRLYTENKYWKVDSFKILKEEDLLEILLDFD